MREYENDINNHKDKEKMKVLCIYLIQKINDLEYDKKVIEFNEYQNYLENQKMLKHKLQFKNDYDNDMDKINKKKHVFKLLISRIKN